MDRLVELAVGIAKVQDVDPLGRFVVSLPRLRSDGITAQSDSVRLDYLTLTKQLQCVLLLKHEYPVGVQGRLCSHLGEAESAKATKSEGSTNQDAHVRDYRPEHSAKC